MGYPTIADIRSELATSGRALVVVGTGITLAATAGTPAGALASWDGLLRHGIKHATHFGRRSEAWASTLRSRLDPPDLDAFIAVAAEICSALGAPAGGEYRRWLELTVGSFRANGLKELEALRDLGLPLATTNYDGLLEEITGLAAATWQDNAPFEDLLHGKPPRAILHLHGHWQRPDSVIFDPAAYQRAAPVIQRLLQTLRLTHTLLFIGCGTGLADPNWSNLLLWSRNVLAGSRYRHFRLCRTEELPDLELQHPPEERLFPVAYGTVFADLSPFLRQLQPPPRLRHLHIPAPSYCFGREEEVESLVAAMCAQNPSPIAVLGPPGAGKTTVTLVALRHPRVAAHFGDRRYFVHCVAATSRGLLLNALAMALQLELAPSIEATDLEERILAHLAGSPALLVFDNAETPWENGSSGFESLVSDLATGLPGLAIVASLRGSERPIGPAWRDPISLGLLAPEPARRTFLAVAGEAYAGDLLLDRLLAEVGNLPLALVLLGSQAEGVPLSGLWNRWQQERTGLLQRAGGGTPANDLELSISLSLRSPRLTPRALRLAALLSLLPEGMAAVDLHALEPDTGEDSAARLHKVGLAVPYDPRHRLFSPIREVLARNLPPEPEDRERLLAHYYALAELGEGLGTERGSATVERLAPELGNLEALLIPALDGPYPESALAAVLPLVELARFTGVLPEVLFDHALLAARRGSSPQGLAQCLSHLADLSLDRSELNVARQRYEEALSLFRRTNNLLGEANCIKGLGDTALRRSEYDAACFYYEKALSLYCRIGGALGEANCIRSLGDISLALSDHDTASARYDEALSIFRRVGSFLGEASCIRRIGDVALRRADHQSARNFYEKALPLFRRVGHLLGEATCIKGLGDIALGCYDYDAANAYYEESLSLFRRLGNLLGEANCLLCLGDIALCLSDEAASLRLFEQALHVYQRIPQPFAIGWTHCRLARLAHTDPERQSHHVQSARSAWESIHRLDLVAGLDQEFFTR